MKGRGTFDRLTLLVGALVAVGVLASVAAAAAAGIDARVSTHDLVPSDSYAASTGVPDVFQQNEPPIAVHPTNSSVLAVGMNDVRTLALSNDVHADREHARIRRM